MKTSRTIANDLPISTKKSVEVCNFIRGRELEKAKMLLEQVLEYKAAVPFKKYNMGAGHKKGKVGPGKYPINVCNEILSVLKLAEANAKNLNLSMKNIYIKLIMANMASRPWHYGRFKRRKMKRTHIEVILSEKGK